MKTKSGAGRKRWPATSRKIAPQLVDRSVWAENGSSLHRDRSA